MGVRMCLYTEAVWLRGQLSGPAQRQCMSLSASMLTVGLPGHLFPCSCAGATLMPPEFESICASGYPTDPWALRWLNATQPLLFGYLPSQAKSGSYSEHFTAMLEAGVYS
jgi:hypothetical protein